MNALTFRSPLIQGATKWLERACTLLLVLSFTLPLALGLWLQWHHPHTGATAWLRNTTLNGVQERNVRLPLTENKLLSGHFQSAFAREYDTNFPARELLIRLIDELYLRIFHMSPIGVLVGPGNNLHERAYLEDYCVRRGSSDELRPLVEKLKLLQDFFVARGRAFALVLTPSKASIEPQTIPTAWLRKYRSGPRYYDRLIGLLTEHGVKYIDGHRLTLASQGTAALPAFPVGGVHWGDPAALATVNGLLDDYRKQGLGVAPITHYDTRVSHHPTGQDRDLALLINTLLRPNYPVSVVSVHPVPMPEGAHRPNLVVVGGSFSEKIIGMLGASRQFSEIDFYSYYHLAKKSMTTGDMHVIAEPAPPLDFNTDVYAADAVLLELNEELMYKPQHLTSFLQDALAVLPNVDAPSAPFHYEGHYDYRWGDIVSLQSNKAPAHITSTIGLAPPSSAGAFTEKTVTSLRLGTTPATEDMILEVNAQPFLSPPQLREQIAKVSVNGHVIGSMTWGEDRRMRRQLLVPKAYLVGDETMLEFRLDTAMAPLALGKGGDPRALGICIAEFQISPASQLLNNQLTPADGLPVYHWGETLGLRDRDPPLTTGLKGFTPAGPDGSFTNGTVASIQMLTTPAPADMTLTVQALPFLFARAITQQSVDVFVNRHAVGRCVWTEGIAAKKTLVVPKDFLDQPVMEVEFRVDHPRSPAEVGFGSDPRKLGISVMSVQLREAVK